MALRFLPFQQKMREAKLSRAQQLKQLRELRETGHTRLSEYQVQEAKPIFEEVTEAEYNAIAIRNLRQENFIVDDNGEGYVDNGLEDWDNVSDEYESEEEMVEESRGSFVHFSNGE